MSVLMVPGDLEAWPTLGPLVCQFIEECLVFGPGDLRGMPAVLDDEKRALIWRMYEVYPKGHIQAGRRRFKRVGLSLAKGLAKALALDTPLPTPTGWTTMDEVQPGDYLLGSNGKPCLVMGVSQVFLNRPCCRVVFNDNTEIVADAEHRWYTKTRMGHRGGEGVYTTEQIKETLYWHPTKPYSNHRIPVAAPLELPEQELPIDPYILGSWLGDGRSDDSEFTMDESDYQNFCKQVKSAGYFSAPPKHDRRNLTTLAVRVSVNPVHGANNNGKQTLKGLLRNAGLLNNKHIPPVYLRASLTQRQSLMQGLMDTDGTAYLMKKRQPRCEYVATNKVLADGVLELARSLGLRPTIIEGRARIYGRDISAVYKVGFIPRDDMQVFRLPRKAEKAKRTSKKISQALARTIRAVEPTDSVPVKCVAVDTPDHLYLAGESMVPTHNTELAAWIAACELHPEAPVRCDGFDKHGNPLGCPVRDPYIPMVAYTEEQSDELAYGALKAILEESPIRDDFDIGMERIMRKRGGGKAVSLSTSPSARDGARTTFQLADETHWWTLPRLVKAHQTMMANLPKRKIADAWALEVTTAPEPGTGSVAEATMDYAKAIHEGRVKDARLFFFHRQASDTHDLDTVEGARAAVIEASGPAASWRDIDAIVELWRDPTTDRSYWERVWTNRLVKSSQKAFDVEQWRNLTVKESPVKKGDLITLGFDGAQFRDAAGLVATHIDTGYQWVLGAWECPFGQEGNWQVPAGEVDDVVVAAFQRYNVWRMYADPPYWQSWIAKWAGEYSDDKVIEWWTNRRKQMSYALEGFDTAMTSKDISHDGNDILTRHIGNAYRHDLPQRDEEGKALWLIRKERHDSPHKIDLAMAAVLSWEARTDAIASGANTTCVYNSRPSILTI